jgi:integrase
MNFVAGGVCFQLYPLARKGPARTLICYKVGSRRERITFKGDREAAERECKSHIAKTVTSGEAAIHLSPLDNRVWIATKETAAKIGRAPDAICREYLEAAQILGAGTSLLEAAREWRRRHRLGLPRVEVSQIVNELLASLAGKRRAASTVKSLRIPLRNLASHLRMPIGDVQTADLERWLQLHPRLAPRTQNNWINAVIRLFNFSKGRYLPADASTAADALDLATNDRRGSPVEIFQPWELIKLLAHAPPHLRYLISLGAFAGLRTIEIHRLDWSAIHFASSPGYPHGFIEVGGNVAKQHRTAARRIVPMQPNLASWLEPARFLTGRVSRYAADQAMSAAITGVIDRLNVAQKKQRRPLLNRPANGARHSYGSYRLPVLGSLDLLALEMGNSAQEILHAYRELVHPDRVPEYWAIEPVPPETIEQIDFAAGFGF